MGGREIEGRERHGQGRLNGRCRARPGLKVDVNCGNALDDDMRKALVRAGFVRSMHGRKGTAPDDQNTGIRGAYALDAARNNGRAASERRSKETPCAATRALRRAAEDGVLNGLVLAATQTVRLSHLDRRRRP